MPIRGKSAALAQLRALRQSGESRLKSYQVQETTDVYDEVDEEGYKKVVRNRLDQDDFVVDDNGQGYADDGREDWAHDRRPYSDSEEEPLPTKGKSNKRKREEEKDKREKDVQNINSYFKASLGGSTAPKPKPVATAADQDFMAGLLGDIDSNISTKSFTAPKQTKSQQKRKVQFSSRLQENASTPIVKRVKTEEGILPQTPPLESAYSDEDILPPLDDSYGDLDDEPMPSSPVAKAVERKLQIHDNSDSDDEQPEVIQTVARANVKTTGVNAAGARPIIKPKESSYPTPESSSPTGPATQAVDASSWNAVNAKLNVMSSPSEGTSVPGKLKSEDVLESDDSLLMFWTDYTEINGALYLFGKVKDKSSGKYVSSFLKVNNILRKLYFLPRETRRKDSSSEVTFLDVYNEVVEIMNDMGVDETKMKECTRKYAFELPDVPSEAKYLKLLYPYDKPVLPENYQGDTFSHVFGANTSMFEQFVLWRDVMGPCWLRIEEPVFSGVSNASWCRLETQANRPAQITPLSESKAPETPNMTVASVALRTVLNVKENRQEVFCATLRVYPNMSLNDTTPTEKLPCQIYSVIRPTEAAFPLGFETAAKQRGGVRIEKSEQGLLSFFLAKIGQVDPDILIGHQLQDVDISTILSRLKIRKTPMWSRIGRLRRSEWPKNFGKVGGSFFAERQLVSGRLMCDIANDMGRSLMTKCQSWSLSEMCELYLPGRVNRQELDTEIALNTWAKSKEGLMNFLTHCETDTYFIAAIAFKIQIVPLAKVLTNLAGNSWARTLGGTRAERNEYILLHEFHRKRYICPDKSTGKKATPKLEEGADGAEGAPGKKKDKYKGGLVFEPEKGLHDKFILVMDFNSLYPSIIREYNICFTTVDRSKTEEDEEERVPEVPEEQDLGILPRLIATLVERRKAVKGLMKDKNATSDELATWDIKQTALKLTANSMYGCLGYERSRFYARPLAMLTTSKGREILMSTKELAESNSLRVVYGDTDSVMINTNADNYADARKIGIDFKKAVNERYKLLEIDIDNVFSRLLLHQKKKYAAKNVILVDGKYEEKVEVKGLDMRRREYCGLSKEASTKVLEEILSGKETETIVENIHDYLRKLAESMREGKEALHKFIIYMKLGKNPKAYGSAGDNQPQVQVALRELAKGKNVRENDVMAYIITGDNNDSKENAARRAYTLDDVRKADSGLSPDAEYYISKQIFPPIERLCGPIEGTDSVRLAECLGLDTRRYQSSSNTNREQAELLPLESQIPDKERFQDAHRLSLRCRKCKEAFDFQGIAQSPEACSNEGVTCPRSECRAALSTFTVAAQLEAQIRLHTTSYYNGYLVCDELTCEMRSRQMRVNGHACLGRQGLDKDCSGTTRYEYSEKALCNQLLYFQSLWDVDKAKKAASGEEAERVQVVAEYNRKRFEVLYGVVQNYLNKCGRLWVQMDALFPKRS